MSESNQQIHGVIFDMDGVLCDSEPFICEAACRLFAERYGVEVKPEDFIPFVGTGENRYLGGVAEKYNIHLDIEADKQRTYEIYLQIIQGRLQPLPGVHEFITLCYQHNLRLAVATSADRIKMEGNLHEIGLTPDSFDACVTGNDIERKKPHPDIFLHAAMRLGFPAEACLVIEDAPNGVEAAKAAGAWCLGLTSSFPQEHLRSAGADWIAPDLAQVPQEVLNLIAAPSTPQP
ncbi:MAG: HAD-IA family hydrolase [Abitibacteriaceae bacterium]|nr:HAD-IA family hydrolase [Abditibacteriaceae bacterium]MBV9864341.1 HAD-IA family hydrolase [Abditibacteriaceae bacterium]